MRFYFGLTHFTCQICFSSFVSRVGEHLTELSIVQSVSDGSPDELSEGSADGVTLSLDKVTKTRGHSPFCPCHIQLAHYLPRSRYLFVYSLSYIVFCFLPHPSSHMTPYFLDSIKYIMTTDINQAVNPIHVLRVSLNSCKCKLIRVHHLYL